jgi:hypothetical protein
MNAAWHAENRLPKTATEAQRIAWHLTHREECARRPIPQKLQARMRELARVNGKPTRPAANAARSPRSGSPKVPG